MGRIFVTRPIPGVGIGLLEESVHEVEVNGEDRVLERGELLERIRGFDGVLTQMADRVDAEFLDAAGEGLKCVSNYAVGYNNFDVAEAKKRGVVCCNTPGVLTEATADIAWTLLMGVARRVYEGERMVREGRFGVWSPTMLLGGDLVGKTLAVIGAGRIGYAVARRAMGWNMKVMYVSRSVKEDWERDFGAEKVGLREALEGGDFVSVHVPLNEETTHLIGREELGWMKESAYLINTARGPVIDEKALVEVLQAGGIAGAGLDVYEEEPKLAEGLVDCENALLLPHLGSATIFTRSEMGRVAAENLIKVLNGEDGACVIEG